MFCNTATAGWKESARRSFFAPGGCTPWQGAGDPVSEIQVLTYKSIFEAKVLKEADICGI